MANDFNPLRNFNQGFDVASRRREAEAAKAEQERLRAQRESFVNAKNKGDSLKQLIIDQPKIGFAFMKEMQTDEKGLDALIEDSVMIKHQLEIDPTGASAMELLQNRKQVLNSGALGGNRNSFQTDQAIAVLQNEGPQKLHENMSMFIDIPNQLGRQKATETATQKDFSTFQDLMAKAQESGDPKDKKKAERFGRAARFIRETEQEKADIKVTQKERETMAKANVTRKQGFIDSGIEAANGAANVSRALTLLDELKTGGFDNFALKAKRLFGIEGADEGELSNLMGKAVLSQLKPIFGAAFTVTESNKLDALEAGFGKSTANNKRLLENSLKIINRAARRGIAAAEDQGDDFTANEIREALAFKLEDKIIPADAAPQQPVTEPTPATQGVAPQGFTSPSGIQFTVGG